MEMQEAFPQVDAGVTPVGSRVLIQIRMPKRKTKGGIILADEARDTDSDNTQIAKVVATGALAYRNRDTLAEWPEKDWCKPGDFVRVPKYLNERWRVKHGDEYVWFAIIKDLDVLGLIHGDPLEQIAYV